MKTLLVILALGISGCAAAPATGHQKQVSIDAAFQPIVNKFLVDAKAEGRTDIVIDDLIVKFGDLGTTPTENFAGFCEFPKGGSPTITINTNAIYSAPWNTLSAADQETIIYHELGHCILHRNHNENFLAPVAPMTLGWPQSVMYPSRVVGEAYEANRAYYMSELFGKE